MHRGEVEQLRSHLHAYIDSLKSAAALASTVAASFLVILKSSPLETNALEHDAAAQQNWAKMDKQVI